MNPDGLRNYIDAQRQSGVADETIRQNLITSGWSEAIIQPFLNPDQPPLSPVATPLPTNLAQALPANPPPANTGFFQGRLSRLGFLMALVYVAVYFVLAVTLAIIGHGSPIINILIILLGMVGIIAVIPITISIHVRRWHDLGHSGWLTLLGLVPLVGFITTILLLVLPGRSEPNQYGAKQRQSLSPKVIFGLSR